MNKLIKVKSENIGKRLDIFLTEKDEDKTRSQWQKMIKAGGVLVNGKNQTAHYFLKEGDRIEIRNKKLEIRENANTDTNQYFENIKIIFETPEYVVINKPAGLLVHPTVREEKNTLVDWLIEKYPGIEKVAEHPDRPGIVHRIDKEVSGLLVVPKTFASFENLKSQFKKRETYKEYITLVYGEVEKNEDRINKPIIRSKIKGFFVAQHKNDTSDLSKNAITDYQVMTRYKNFTLLKVKILTGRTHQIRVHLKSIGHSVVGDNLYLTHDIKNKKNKKVELGRIFLHASLIGFKDLNGECQEFISELPSELKTFLRKLKKTNA